MTSSGLLSVRRRAFPLAVALALVALVGLLTDTVAAANVLAIAGPGALSIIFPVSGLLMGLSALLQFTSIDGRPRLTMIRLVAGICSVAFVISLAFLATGLAPAVAIGAVWVVGDQFQFLMPLLLWSLAGDVFNTAESKSVYGWILAWTFAGQIIALAVATLAPLVSDGSFPLPALLIVNPIAAAVIAIGIPIAMRGKGESMGQVRRDGLGEAIADAVTFYRKVPTWRALLIGAVITATAGILGLLAFTTSGESIIGRDADELQFFIAGTTLVLLLLSLAFETVVQPRLHARTSTAGLLLVLPFATVVAGLLLALGAFVGSLPLLAVAMVVMGVPTWTVDESARQAALTVVPDQLRARVSFVIDVGRFSVAQIVAGGLLLVGTVLGLAWLSGLLTALLAAIAIPFGFSVLKTWDASMLNWRLRRRKHTSMPDFED